MSPTGRTGAALLLAVCGGILLGYLRGGGESLPVAAAEASVAAAPAAADIQAIAVGEVAPALYLPDLAGGAHALEEWRGKALLVNFWASWCAPCQYEIRDLVRLQARYGERGLQVIGIGVDEADKLANVQRTLAINYPVLAGGAANTALLARWGNERGVVPYNVVITAEGRIHRLVHGPLDEEGFNDLVLPLLDP